MKRFFNTAGPCRPEIHYTLSSTHRLPELKQLVDQQTYFVLHAPRQVGKTTTLMNLAEQLTTTGRYAAVVVSMEAGAAFPHDIGAAEDAILRSWQSHAKAQMPVELRLPSLLAAPPGARIGSALEQWCEAIARPLVVFLDEIDALQDNVLLSVLRQLRSGYPTRPKGFPWSLGLVGLRDVRDYKIASGGGDSLRTSSPFNIKVKSLTLSNFTCEEVSSLYQQHTDETGQAFESAALARAFELTGGQPWLVNALAREITEVLVPDRRQAITADNVDHAKDILIQRQDTHLDSLAERLREPRVRAVIEPILAGTELPDVPNDDVRFVVDLGLVLRADGGGLVVANPIYREVIPRALADNTSASLPRIAPTWLRPDGTLDPAQLLASFLVFWRQHGQPLRKSVHYHEIAPHIVLMAFLHRVVNGGGRVEREYAIGSGRMDLLVTYGPQQVAMELKVWRDDEKDPLEKGALAQLDGYLAGLSLATGWLVIFDQRAGQPPVSERTHAREAATPAGRTVTVVYA